MIVHEILETLNGTTKRRNRINVAVGTTVGVLLGVAAGILLAPKSGKETRKDIKKAAEVGLDNVNKAAQSAAKFVKKEVAEVKEKVNVYKTHKRRPKETLEEAAESIAEDVETNA